MIFYRYCKITVGLRILNRNFENVKPEPTNCNNFVIYAKKKKQMLRGKLLYIYNEENTNNGEVYTWVY